MRFNHSPLSFAVLTVLSTPVFAETNKQNTPEAQVKLETIVLEAEQANDVGQTAYHADQLKQMPNGKKSITEFLRLNSNVQFQRDSLNAGTQASLASEEISINGAPFFSNKFIVNGVNTSNTFDPIGASADTNFTSFPNSSQTANISTDLLCELTVLDSNVSAEHGDFQGGVISAKTCAPKTEVGKMHGSVSYDYTTDAWSRFNYIDAKEEAAFEDSQDSKHHREYTTQGLSTNLYGRLSEQWGLNFTAAQRNSRIPVLSGFTEDKIKTEENNDSIGLTTYFNLNEDHKYQFGYDYFSYDKDGYTKNLINSNFNTQTATHTAFINAIDHVKNVTIEQNLNYRTTESERKMKQNYTVLWDYSEGSKDWRESQTLSEGGTGGTLINAQENLSYDIKALFNPIHFLNTIHQFKVGAEYKHNEGSWIRPEATTTYTTRQNLKGKICALGDILCDEASLKYKKWQGQFTNYGAYYGAGEYTARQDQGAVFLEDLIQWNNWSARLGLRGDYESLADNFNLAPRFNLQYTPFGNEALKLTSGYNRYYGSTYLITELDEKAYINNGKLNRDTQYSDNWSADNNYGWVLTNNPGTGGTKATDLDTPYSDEKLLALNSKLNNFDIELKWVNRAFHDQVRQQKAQEGEPRTFINANGGKSDTYSFNVTTLQPYTFLNLDHAFGLGVSYIDNKTFRGNFRMTDDNSAGYNTTVIVEGKEILKSNLPTKDQPITARLSWNIESLDKNFKIYNFLNYRSGSSNYVSTGEKITTQNGDEVNVMEKEDFASRFTWDSRVAYDWQVSNRHTLTTGLTISNLLNKQNISVTDSGAPYSEEGRRFVADITFKF